MEMLNIWIVKFFDMHNARLFECWLERGRVLIFLYIYKTNTKDSKLKRLNKDAYWCLKVFGGIISVSCCV